MVRQPPLDLLRATAGKLSEVQWLGPFAVNVGNIHRDICRECLLVRWNGFESPQALDPVLKAGVAHFWFVTIHPLDGGNRRIARAIADMALSQADGTKDRFYSMSSGIEAQRKEYCQRLEAAQRGSLDITAWLAWFLSCFDRTIEDADASLGSVPHKAKLWQRINPQPVNERQRKAINRMLGDFQGHLNTSKYAKLARCSKDTALRDIRELLERGIVVKNPAGGRSTSYWLADPDDVPA